MPRKPDMPCASCGTLLWRRKGISEPGKSTCRACRRARASALECSRAGCPREHYAKGFCRTHYRTPGGRRSGAAVYVYIPRAARLAIYERDGWVCQICGDAVDRVADPKSGLWAPTLDHIVPKSQGGSHEPNNLRLAHRWCNSVLNDGRKYSAADLGGACDAH